MDQNQNGLPKFPKNFLFGAATAAHQVEGNNFNDWSVWEEQNADQLSKKSGHSISNHISGRAANHYELFEKDLDLAKSLGHNAYRFSIEWSRIEPEHGMINEKEIRHYQKVVEACLARNIEPFVTLWHWTHPIWFRDHGGWESKKAVKYFTNFVEKMVKSLPKVKYWITLNEPGVYTNKSYRQGHWPPQKKNLFSYLRVTNALIAAHKKAYEVIKSINFDHQVGVASHLTYIDGFKPFIKPASWWANNHFINKIKDCQDFIGVNYYFHVRLLSNKKGDKFSDMGWELYPEGIYKVLKNLEKFHKPIFITEHGLADAQDKNRACYIKESLVWIKKAIDEGVDVRGYLHWSLLDNFEWADGFWPRFGLIEVDYENNFTRHIRPSAYEYANIIKNSIADE